MEKDILVVVDMQNDFIDGSLGTQEACGIVERVCEKIRNFEGMVLATLDTHEDNYLEKQEGKKLPVKHCIKGEKGWELNSEVKKEIEEKKGQIFEKNTFGSVLLGEHLSNLADSGQIAETSKIVLVGLCTDICVISNALLIKAYLPEAEVSVDAACCAGVTVQRHKNALEAMKMCQIGVLEQEA